MAIEAPGSIWEVPEKNGVLRPSLYALVSQRQIDEDTLIIFPKQVKIEASANSGQVINLQIIGSNALYYDYVPLNLWRTFTINLDEKHGLVVLEKKPGAGEQVHFPMHTIHRMQPSEPIIRSCHGKGKSITGIQKHSSNVAWTELLYAIIWLADVMLLASEEKIPIDPVPVIPM
ncbi:hypothetical protein SCLCIDRAFT_26199 [Scleroderma citrinum Foug A]|uniref:Uncharacterized protein n=1 Tax=Scleroderma citrinum Foug A TaxID=1036808 RepID=A0A0C3DYW2_9AGAM|nr:hypothetical protein SCLCIDRAFT_26199 [Scleroderma citrinum Foug A]